MRFVRPLVLEKAEKERGLFTSYMLSVVLGITFAAFYE